MKIYKYRFVLLFLPFMFLFSESTTGQRVTGQSAAEAFTRGEYQKAYDQYVILLESFPRDPLYLYGAGVSLVNLKRSPAEAVGLIDRALASTSAIRTIPGDALFFLARALHLGGRYEEAIETYEMFSDAAGRREARALGVQELIRDCSEKRGAIPESGSVPVISPIETDSVKPNLPEMLPVATDSVLGDALRYRLSADSLKREAQADTSLLKQSLRDTLKSDSLMTVAGLPVKVTGKADESGTKEITALEADTLKVGKTEADTLKIDTPVAADIQPVREHPTITSLFELKSEPYYSANNPITISSAFPEGLYYSIQMAVFRNPVPPTHFKGLYPVFGIKSAGSELTFYYAGLFRNSADAARALPVVRNQGFRDAFVVIFMDGKPVSAERGSLLEKEWGNRGFGEWKGVVPGSAVRSEQADTVPPTLLFRVEVMRTNSQIESRQLSELERIAAERGLEIMRPSSSIFVYLVGKFLNFESASAYADLLVRNGYKDARVAAYLGSREIPVETALKYFDR
ncbi:MAG: hypothetical protein R6W67_07805 [Bacteroidales bacterium]